MGQVKEQQEIGKRLGRDTSTITRWLQKYRSGGISRLLEIKKAPGATPKMTEEVIAALFAGTGNFELVLVAMAPLLNG